MTHWPIQAPIGGVFDALMAPERYAGRRPRIGAYRSLTPGRSGVGGGGGRRGRAGLRHRLRYISTTTEPVPPRQAEYDARSVVRDHLLERVDHFTLGAHLPTRNPEASGDPHEVGIGDLGQGPFALARRLGMIHGTEVGVCPVASVKAILPLHDHPQVLV